MEKDIEYKYFHVKSGENKGHYIAISNDMDIDTQKALLGYRGEFFKDGMGGIIQDHNVDFYKRHSCYNKAIIWLISSYYLGHKLSEERIEHTKKELNENGFIMVDKFTNNK